MAALANSLVVIGDLSRSTVPRGIVKPPGRSLVILKPSSLSLIPVRQSKTKAAASKSQKVVNASFSRQGARPSSTGVFIGGFVLGGIIMGMLGCVYAPQISKALAAADNKDLMKKLPKFIYDEEKALEKTRRVLTNKIAQLNAAIDDVSSQLQAADVPNGVAVISDEVEAAI